MVNAIWTICGLAAAYLAYRKYVEHYPVHNQEHPERAEILPEDTERKIKSGLAYDMVPVNEHARSFKDYKNFSEVNSVINKAGGDNTLLDVPEEQRRCEFSRLIIQSSYDRA